MTDAGLFKAHLYRHKPTVGYQTVNADGTGKVQVEATGRLLLITDVDEPSGTCGLVLA